MSENTKFDLSDLQSIQDYFQQHGYVVVRRAIEQEKIDTFLSSYESIRRHPLFVYYSQSIHVCTRPKLNSSGFIKESMQNASRLAFFRKFSRSFQACIYHSNVADSLTAVTGEQEHVSWQNMFFDRSTGTIDHQDSWYLDTEPAGNLVGVWYALEDIEQDSGPFFVIPGSHHIGLLDRADYPDHDAFVDVVREKIDELAVDKQAMTLDKGDILLWHPFLIHGAFACGDEAKSRKSFTSHFYPKSCTAKDTEKDKWLSIYDHEHPRPTQTARLYSAYRFSDHFYNILVYGLYVKHKLLRIKKRLSMRRADYAGEEKMAATNSSAV